MKTNKSKLNATILVATSDVKNSPEFTDFETQACISFLGFATVYLALYAGDITIRAWLLSLFGKKICLCE